MKRKGDRGSLKALSTSVHAGSPRDESVRLADVCLQNVMPPIQLPLQVSRRS
jgi:hypothetical protein